MPRYRLLHSFLLGSSAALAMTSAFAEEPREFDIAQGDLKAALDTYEQVTGTQLLYAADKVKGVHTEGAHGVMLADAALVRILKGTQFTEQSDPSGAISLYDAIEKQLGLKLEKTKRPAQVLVIDHIEPKPIEN